MPGRRGRSSPGAEKITMLAPGEPHQGDRSIIWGPPLKKALVPILSQSAGEMSLRFSPFPMKEVEKINSFFRAKEEFRDGKGQFSA